MSQTHLAGGALFTAAGLGAASAAGWMHAPVWALAIGIAWGALAGELPDIDHRRARVSRAGASMGVAGALLGVPVRIVGVFIRGLRVKHRGPTHSLTCLALWAAIAAPLYMACGGVMVLALAWAVGTLAAIAHTSAPMRTPAVMPWLLRYLAAVYPPVRGSDHGPWICLASGARLAHRSASLGLAIRSSTYRTPAHRTQDPHRLADRDLAAAAGDHDRCRHRGSRGRGTTVPSALTCIACRGASTSHGEPQIASHKPTRLLRRSRSRVMRRTG